MRVGAALGLASLVAMFDLPAFAQDASPVTATVEDAERVYLTFETIDLLVERCAAETKAESEFEAARAGWMERNERTKRLADRVLAHLEASVDVEALVPRATEDTEALLNSIVPEPELCRTYLAQMTAGDMDLSRVVPDLYNRLVLSDGAIAALERKP